METKMGRSMFKVAIVKRGKEALWRDYWINSESRGTVDAAPSGLGCIEVVEATSADEAVNTVQRMHPDCTVMLAGGEHHVA
jgi:CheY-like chemotaxis protein